ncbi:major prion protein homolog [Sander lucioperca]|uniref:Prion protein, related sequence 3 n=1 Tax=Sander lucioperca TaxID=283035 RepID=A0A8C9Z2L5_SANLU|nr:major prion protein homolog [Sander lucioperca]
MNSLSVLCLSLLLFHTHFSLARKGGSFGKGSFSSKKSSPHNRVSTNTNSNANKKNNQGSSSQGGYPKQPGQPNQGGYPMQSGRPGYPGNYPQQPGGGYHNQFPARGSPYSHGGYGGGYMNYNPNNKVLSPRYGGSFGYGGHGAGGGSPFSHSVQSMGMYPSDKSRGFGRSAVMAAAGGAMAGMALGYGLGRFPRPHYQFHNSQEEQYYNNYMYRKYGTKSTDSNDYSRDYIYSKPSETYDSYMDSCMKRTDILPAANQKPNNKPAVTTTTSVTPAPDTGTGSNTTETNNTAADNSSTIAPSSTQPLNQPVANPVPTASQAVSSAEDGDTVSIVEIGYPALIEQMKARRCVELYMVYSEKYLKRVTGSVQGLSMGSRGLLAVVISTTLMLLNSNMLVLLR